MITIGPAVPGVPAAAEKTIGVVGDAAGAADMFGDIISGMAAALGAEAADAEAAPDDQVDQPAGEVDPAAAIVQLLALTARQQGKARKEPEGDAPVTEQPAGGCEVDVPILGNEGSGTVSAALPGGAPILAQMPTAEPRPAKAEPETATPQVKPQAETVRQVAELAKAIVEPEAEKAAPRTVAAAQIADLLKAVTKPITLANVRVQPAERPQVGDEAAAAPMEPRSLVQAALSASVPPTFTPFEAPRPAEAAIESLNIEPQIDLSDVAIERQLDVSAEGEWLDSLAKDIARTAGEGGTLRFRLNPENLGTLRVEITPQANGSAVRLTADTDAARTIIADAQTRLVAEAKANGVRIAETHVDLGGQSPSGDPRRQNAAFEEAPIRTARFLRDQEEGDGKPTPSKSERYA